MPRDRMEQLVRRVPSATMATIDAGHLVHATRPAEFTTVVSEFLQPE